MIARAEAQDRAEIVGLVMVERDRGLGRERDRDVKAGGDAVFGLGHGLSHSIGGVTGESARCGRDVCLTNPTEKGREQVSTFDRGGPMRIGAVVVAVIVAGLLLALNPGIDSYNAWARQKLGEQGGSGKVPSALMPSLAIEATTRRNMLFFSLYETKIAENASVRTLGVLSNFILLSVPEAGTPKIVAQLPPAAAPPANAASDEPHCDNAVVSKQEGRFLPAAGTQLLTVAREQATAVGSNDGPYCKYTVRLSRLDPASHADIVLWQIDLPGPGAVFSGGDWHRQATVKQLDVRPVRVLPLPMDQLQQILLYRHDDAADGGGSVAEIIAFPTPYGNAAGMLSVRQHGNMAVKVEDRDVVIDGYFIPRGACNACGEARSLRLRYDRTAKQLAIVAPDQRSIEFYRFLTGTR